MASGLLGAVLTMGGCLLPQDYRFSDDPPPFKNNPVKIAQVALFTTTLTTYNGEGGTRPCSLQFSAGASDPDIDDRLTVRWYVDYDKDTNQGFFHEESLDNRGSATRDAVRLTMNLDSPDNPLVLASTHVMEVLVTDGQLVDREPQPRSVDLDAGINPTYVDRYVWIVKTERGDCP